MDTTFISGCATVPFPTHVLRGCVAFAQRVTEEVKNGMQEGSFQELVIDDQVIQ